MAELYTPRMGLVHRAPLASAVDLSSLSYKLGLLIRSYAQEDSVVCLEPVGTFHNPAMLGRYIRDLTKHLGNLTGSPKDATILAGRDVMPNSEGKIIAAGRTLDGILRSLDINSINSIISLDEPLYGIALPKTHNVEIITNPAYRRTLAEAIELGNYQRLMNTAAAK